MKNKQALLASAIMRCSTQAFAAMPLKTEDTGTQGKGRSQIKIGLEFGKRQGV